MQFFAHVIYKLTLSVDKIALKMSLDNFSIAQIKSPQPLLEIFEEITYIDKNVP